MVTMERYRKSFKFNITMVNFDLLTEVVIAVVRLTAAAAWKSKRLRVDSLHNIKLSDW